MTRGTPEIAQGCATISQVVQVHKLAPLRNSGQDFITWVTGNHTRTREAAPMRYRVHYIARMARRPA